MSGSERKPGGYFREWRDFTGLSQEEAAHKADRDRTHLSKIERGLEPYSQSWLERLAAAYYCSPAELLLVNPFEADARDLVDLFRSADPQIQRAVMRILGGAKEEPRSAPAADPPPDVPYRTEPSGAPTRGFMESRGSRESGLPIDKTGLDQEASDAALARLARLKRKPRRR